MHIPEKRKTASIILKSVTVIAAASGTYLSALGGSSGFMLGARAFMYFTIQSNILIALICAAGAVMLLKGSEASDIWYTVKFVGTVSITLTAAVFTFVLAPTLGDFAWQPQNILTHLVAPIAAIADFFVTGVFGDIKKRDVLWVELPPLLYVIYAAVCYINGLTFADGNTYPYFFLNWGGEQGALGFSAGFPFMGCVWWILTLGAVILGVGYIYLLILDRMKAKTASPA